MVIYIYILNIMYVEHLVGSQCLFVSINSVNFHSSDGQNCMLHVLVSVMFRLLQGWSMQCILPISTQVGMLILGILGSSIL